MVVQREDGHTNFLLSSKYREEENPVLQPTYTMEPLFTITANGFLLSVDNTMYVLERVGEMLKVTGDGTCYYILETIRGLEQANCTLTVFTLLMGY